MTRSRDPSDLRRRAEQRLGRLGVSDGGTTYADVRRLVHELQVHQIELELQNEELRASRAEVEALLGRYAELFDFAPIGYFHLGDDGRIAAANFAGARLLGHPRAELVGRPFVSFVRHRDRAAFERFLVEVLTRTEEDAPGEVSELALDGGSAGERRVRCTACPLAGTTPGALLAVEDVTARCAAEEALREQVRHKDEFLATLSHELRNPLSPIRNALYLLERTTPSPEKARSVLAVIDRQLGHLTHIVDDLLDVTRIARGKVRLQLERVDLREEVRRTVEDHRAAFEAGEVALACEACADPCWTDADRSRVAQIVGNLLGNALKFTNRGGRVEIRVEREPPSRAALRVRDDGVGLAPEVARRLFEPFSQAPQTLDRSPGGLGLGLAMVKGLVELHRGTVEVRSEGPGRGSEFVVRLPLADPPAEPRRPGPPPLGPPRRVLVVDDNDDAATTLKDVLELGGHEVRVARDGAGALAAARAFRPEIVICDIGLPGMDGYAVARAIRAEPGLAAVWLVAMSGYAAAEDVRRAHEAGFDRHVAKPATVDRLAGLLAEAPAPAAGARPPSA